MPKKSKPEVSLNLTSVSKEELIRDLCSVEFRSKSATRKLVDKFLKELSDSQTIKNHQSWFQLEKQFDDIFEAIFSLTYIDKSWEKKFTLLCSKFVMLMSDVSKILK